MINKIKQHIFSLCYHHFGKPVAVIINDKGIYKPVRYRKFRNTYFYYTVDTEDRIVYHATEFFDIPNATFLEYNDFCSASLAAETLNTLGELNR